MGIDWTKATKDTEGRDVQGVRESPCGNRLQWWLYDAKKDEWMAEWCLYANGAHYLAQPKVTKWINVYRSNTHETKEAAERVAGDAGGCIATIPVEVPA